MAEQREPAPSQRVRGGDRKAAVRGAGKREKLAGWKKPRQKLRRASMNRASTTALAKAGRAKAKLNLERQLASTGIEN